MSRATVDLQSVRFFLGYGLIFFFQNILTVLAVTVVLLFVDWQLALIALAITPVLDRPRVPVQPRLAPGPARRPAEARRRRDRRRGEHRRRPRRQGVRAGARPRRRSSARARSASSRRRVRANRQRAFYVPLISFLPLLAQAAVLLVGGQMVADGSLLARRLRRLQPLVLMLVMPLRMLGMWIGQAQRATASGERIFQVIDEPEEIADRPGAVELPAGAGDVRFETRLVRVRRRTSGAARRRPRDRAGRHGRADRPHGLGQDDAHLARPALLRRDRAAASRRRRRRPRRRRSPRSAARSA